MHIAGMANLRYAPPLTSLNLARLKGDQENARAQIVHKNGASMSIFRLLAWGFVATGLALIGADAVSWLEQGEPVIRTSAEIMGLFGLQVSDVEGGGAAGVANFLLNAPLWALIGGLGIIMTLIFRPLR